ncbi:hypothetical protein JW823_08645 [bacterium]|nr:hypothetical protein [candidate division CSSED10-310 bacterium]
MGRFVNLFLSVICLTVGPLTAFGVEKVAEPDVGARVLLPEQTGFALVMANGMTLRVAEYAIDLEKETVFFKSDKSGLSATFPLERIQRVVAFDNRLDDVPENARLLFVPEKTVGNNAEDDGGIPVLFKVNKTIVGASGNSGYSRAGSSGSSPSGRSSYTSSKSSGSTGSSSTSSSVSGSSGRTSSSTSSSSSSDSANNFFNALFGGK